MKSHGPTKPGFLATIAAALAGGSVLGGKPLPGFDLKPEATGPRILRRKRGRKTLGHVKRQRYRHKRFDLTTEAGRKQREAWSAQLATYYRQLRHRRRGCLDVIRERLAVGNRFGAIAALRTLERYQHAHPATIRRAYRLLNLDPPTAAQ